MIVCGDGESNPDPGSDKRVRVLYFHLRGLHSNLDELAVAGLDYDVLVCVESKVSDLQHLSEIHDAGYGCPNRGCGTLLLVPRIWLCMLWKYSAPSSRASWSILATNPVCFLFAVG